MAARFAGDAGVGHLNPRGHDASFRIVQEQENTFAVVQAGEGGEEGGNECARGGEARGISLMHLKARIILGQTFASEIKP